MPGLECVRPGRQFTQPLFQQRCPASQAIPHPPQLLGSVVVSTQAAPQEVLSGVAEQDCA